MPKAKQPKAPSVWIELEKPENHQAGHHAATLANAMFEKITGQKNQERFFWSEHECRYCFGGNMGYIVCSDNGHWFDLEYMAKPIAAAA